MTGALEVFHLKALATLRDSSATIRVSTDRSFSEIVRDPDAMLRFFFSFPPFADTFRFLEMLRDNSVNKLLQVPKIVLEDSSSFFFKPRSADFLAMIGP